MTSNKSLLHVAELAPLGLPGVWDGQWGNVPLDFMLLLPPLQLPEILAECCILLLVFIPEAISVAIVPELEGVAGLALSRNYAAHA